MSGAWSRLLSYTKSHTLNFDGSHNNQAKKAGAGCIIRDDEGDLVVAASYNLTNTFPDYCDVAITEAVALRNGLKLAQNQNLRIRLIKGDSQEVYNHVVGRSTRCRSEILGKIIVEIKGMLEPFPEFELISRERNRVADKLASIGSDLQSINSRIFMKYDYGLPPQVAELIEQEKRINNTQEPHFNDGEGSTSSTVENVVKAGGALFAVAMSAYGAYKLLSGEGSSDQTEHKNIVRAPHYSNNNNNTVTTKRPLTLHFHGSDSNQTRKARAGCIIRDKQGKLVVAAAYNIGTQDPHYHIAMAEAVALRNGLRLAKEHNIKVDRILGDNDEVINRLHGRQRKLPKDAAFTEIIEEIMVALSDQSIDPQSQVRRIECVDNKVAHKLASIGANLWSGQRVTYTRETDFNWMTELIREDQLHLDIFN